MKETFRKTSVKRVRLSDQIIAVLEQAMRDGTLREGDKLPTEENLAARFKVSKVAVREALREMEGRGLIRKERGMYGGNFIASPDVKQVGESLLSCYHFGSLTEDEIVDFRLTLEPVLIRTATQRRTASDLAAMRANIRACEANFKQDRIRVGMHIEFHILIARACYNKLFVSVMEAIAEIFRGIANPWEKDREIMEMDIEFNRKFYDCILHRQEDKAEQLMKDHFEMTRTFLKRDRENAARKGVDAEQIPLEEV